MSGFNLVGAAQVGKSTLSGMRMLHRLDGIVSLWPFDPLPEHGPVLVETYTTIAARASGCHQGASVAGFHIVGMENLTKVHPLNATRLATSAHFTAEEARRKLYTLAIIEGRAADKVRPVSFLSAKNSAGMPARGTVTARPFSMDTRHCLREALVHREGKLPWAYSRSPPCKRPMP